MGVTAAAGVTTQSKMTTHRKTEEANFQPDAPPSYDDTIKTTGAWYPPPQHKGASPPGYPAPPSQGHPAPPPTQVVQVVQLPAIELGCQDGVSQLPAKYHNTDLLLPQRAGVGHERHPLPDHALALLLHPSLRGQLAEGEAQVPQLQDSAGQVQQLLSCVRLYNNYLGSLWICQV